MVDEDSQARRVLWQIRMVHTIAWVVFASSIVAIPIVTLAGRIHTALWLSLLVWVEVLILAANRLRCPLTGVARRYTRDRSDNFDIFRFDTERLPSNSAANSSCPPLHDEA